MADSAKAKGRASSYRRCTCDHAGCHFGARMLIQNSCTPQQTSCHLAAIVRFSNDAIISTSLSGEIQTWNEGAEKIYGYPAQEVIGRSIAVLDPDRTKGSHRAILQAICAGHEIKHFEACRVKKN